MRVGLPDLKQGQLPSRLSDSPEIDGERGLAAYTSDDADARALPASGPQNVSLSPLITRALSVGIMFAALAGIVQWTFLQASDHVLPVEEVAIQIVEIGFFCILAGLVFWRGRHLESLALCVFLGATIYIFLMVFSGLFLGGNPERALHTGVWLHPAFVAISLTQPVRRAQSLSWAVVFALGVAAIIYAYQQPEGFFASTTSVSLVQLILSLCASSSLLYGLALFRDLQRANRERIAAMQEVEKDLQEAARVSEQARRSAERTNEVMTRFLDNMSHELRTPLNGIIGFSELIRDEIFGAHANAKYKEYAEDIAGSGVHLLGLVNDLLFFSELNAGRFALDVKPLDVDLVLRDAAVSMAQLAETSGVAIETQPVDPEFPEIVTDGMAMRQILRGLLGNAIKFSHTDSTVTLGAEVVEGDICRFLVKDTGVGIPDSEQAEIFDLFQQGDTSDRNAVPGTGLGLATVKTLVDMLGGSISLESVADQGTTVVVSIPMRAGAD